MPRPSIDKDGLRRDPIHLRTKGRRRHKDMWFYEGKAGLDVYVSGPDGRVISGRIPIRQIKQYLTVIKGFSRP